jgi:peptidyl-prolyl cis-trans isomerase B (cyclophilin B)
MLSRLIAVPALCLALSTLAACSGDKDDKAVDPAAQPTSWVDPSAPTTTCDYPADGTEATVDKPDTKAPKQGPVDVTISTSAGDIKASLDSDATPCTVNSFMSLATQGYFDNTTCHRLTTQGIFVLQCGDPTASGMGGPGYSFADELSGKETYGPGTLAMANAGPDTNGSQFFLVYDDSPLPPAYTVFGSIDDASLTVLKDIAAKGTADGGPDGAPKETVTITLVG